MKVFVAGHRGLVGTALVRNAPIDYELITADRKNLDLTDKVAVHDFLKATKPDAVILAAAKVGGISANSKHQKDFLLTNLEIQDAVIDSAANNGIPNLIFLGSSCIYPKLAPQPISESALLTGPLEPTNEGYSLAKIAGIRLCKAISEEQNLNYFSLMPTNLYGQNDNYDLEASHVPAALMRRFHDAKEKGIAQDDIWGTGAPKREFMHVDDMASATWYMLEVGAPGELINVGTGEDITIRDFSILMAEVIGYEGKMNFDTTKPDGTPRKLLDVSKIHALGWRHKIELRAGLNQTYDWFKHAIKKGEIRGY